MPNRNNPEPRIQGPESRVQGPRPMVQKGTGQPLRQFAVADIKYIKHGNLATCMKHLSKYEKLVAETSIIFLYRDVFVNIYIYVHNRY